MQNSNHFSWNGFKNNLFKSHPYSKYPNSRGYCLAILTTYSTLCSQIRIRVIWQNINSFCNSAMTRVLIDEKLNMSQQCVLTVNHILDCAEGSRASRAPLICSCETPPRVSHPALEPSAQEGERCWSKSRGGLAPLGPPR